MERSDLLNKMALHVRYELDKMINFLTIGATGLACCAPRSTS